jgi:hypothetical protein
MELQEWLRVPGSGRPGGARWRTEVSALLVRDFFAEEEKSLILLAGEGLDQFETVSPGGWMDYPEAQEDRCISGRRPVFGQNPGSETRRPLGDARCTKDRSRTHCSRSTALAWTVASGSAPQSQLKALIGGAITLGQPIGR